MCVCVYTKCSSYKAGVCLSVSVCIVFLCCCCFPCGRPHLVWTRRIEQIFKRICCNCFLFYFSLGFFFFCLSCCQSTHTSFQTKRLTPLYKVFFMYCLKCSCVHDVKYSLFIWWVSPGTFESVSTDFTVGATSHRIEEKKNNRIKVKPTTSLQPQECFHHLWFSVFVRLSEV